MSITTTDRSTVAKLLGLIGSAHEAEALAAARKAHELVKAKGATWPEILGIEDTTPSAPESGHVAIARDLLHRGRGIITKWERDFLIGIMAFQVLKPKQVEILAAIQAKVDAANTDL